MKRRFENIYFDFSKMVLVVEWFYEYDLEFTITHLPFDDFTEHLRMMWGNLEEDFLVAEFESQQDYTKEAITNQYMDLKPELI